MTKLAEAYIHLKIDATDDFKKESKYFLYELARSVSNERFNQDTEINIKFEDGSWKAWVTVAGVIYLGIGQYGSFRSGLEYLVKDARNFSQIVVERFIENNNLDDDIIFRSERRLGVPGKINRLFQRIDSVQVHGVQNNVDHEEPQLSSKKGELAPGENLLISQQINIGLEDDSPTILKRSKPLMFSDHLKKEINNELQKIKYEIIDIFNLLDHKQDKNLFLEFLKDTLFDVSPNHNKITIKPFKDLPPNQNIPISDMPIVPNKKNGYPYDKIVIKEEDGTEKLRRLIELGSFDLSIGN